ncbi:MAG: tetraacyldisaccharide 4'-kinase [Gemmatimonadota bacterium]|nr:tetraacyldisaccharide 4'-kinase [Gemmatimonadota bacterium]
MSRPPERRHRGSGGAPPRDRLEGRIRTAWRRGPGPGLRLAALAYGAGHDVRDLLHEAGVTAMRRAAVPVISVGGLTAGGSGKTPVAALLAADLRRAGWSPAVVTAGDADEAALVGAMAPGIRVAAGRDRVAAIGRAVAGGANAVVLDSGFQHRRLARDLDVVCLDPEAWAGPGPYRLPAGPFRERPGALARAGAVVLVVRPGAPETGVEAAAAAAARHAPRRPRAVLRLDPAGLRPANDRAAGRAPGPGVAAAAGVMWPEAFFRTLRRTGVSPARTLRFRDHESFEGRALARVREAAARAGLVCTRKDAVKLGPLLASDVPVWYLDEVPRWGRGGEAIRRAVRHAVGLASLGRVDGTIRGEES